MTSHIPASDSTSAPNENSFIHQDEIVSRLVQSMMCRPPGKVKSAPPVRADGGNLADLRVDPEGRPVGAFELGAPHRPAGAAAGFRRCFINKPKPG